MKAYLNTSTKIDGKLVFAGEVELTKAQHDKLKKDGFIGKEEKSVMPTNEKEVKELVKENETLKGKK